MCVCVCVFVHPDCFHGSIAGQHLSECVLGFLKLLQELPVVLLRSKFSLLQLLPALLQVYHSAAGNTYTGMFALNKHINIS